MSEYSALLQNSDSDTENDMEASYCISQGDYEISVGLTVILNTDIFSFFYKPLLFMHLRRAWLCYFVAADMLQQMALMKRGKNKAEVNLGFLCDVKFAVSFCVSGSGSGQ